MFPEVVHNESIDPGGVCWQPGDGNIVGTANLLPQIVSGQLSLRLFPLLLQLPVLFCALLQAQVQLQRWPTS